MKSNGVELSKSLKLDVSFVGFGPYISTTLRVSLFIILRQISFQIKCRSLKIVACVFLFQGLDFVAYTSALCTDMPGVSWHFPPYRPYNSMLFQLIGFAVPHTYASVYIRTAVQGIRQACIAWMRTRASMVQTERHNGNTICRIYKSTSPSSCRCVTPPHWNGRSLSIRICIALHVCQRFRASLRSGMYSDLSTARSRMNTCTQPGRILVPFLESQTVHVLAGRALQFFCSEIDVYVHMTYRSLVDRQIRLVHRSCFFHHERPVRSSKHNWEDPVGRSGNLDWSTGSLGRVLVCAETCYVTRCTRLTN
jgi:hypothetical protein